MESKDYKRLAIISGAVVTGLIGFFAVGVAGAFLGYIIFLLICLIFWAVRNSNSQ
jgi:F0F1-type ATP synthase assembly protein I